MKFPNYGGGAQGDLLVAHAIDADGLRPYAEVRHYDQIVSRQGMHLYVEREPSEEPVPVSDAVGGVLRMVGHTVGGYTSFKGNDKDLYRPTTELYAVDGQTNPAATWPTFWRRGLSGPAAMWAQFARGFAKAYTDYIEREGIVWSGSPNIGDAVIVVPRPGLAPQVFCIRGYLGAEPVQYLQVQVVPESAFAGAPVPKVIMDLFGGVPFPPQTTDWAAAPAITALAPDAIRTATGVTGSAWEWRTGFQILAVGPYATDGNQADTVVIFQHNATLVSVAAHLRLAFAASTSAALTAGVTRVAGGCPAESVLSILGEEESGGFVVGAIAVGGTGPGWTINGEATCPILVTRMDGRLTTVSAMRRRSLNSSGYVEYEAWMRVSGAVSLDAYGTRLSQVSPDESYYVSSYDMSHVVSGVPGAWTVVTTEKWSIDADTGTPTTRGRGTFSRLNFWGDEGGFYVVSINEVGVGQERRVVANGSGTIVSENVSSTDSPPTPMPYSVTTRGNGIPSVDEYAWYGYILDPYIVHSVEVSAPVPIAPSNFSAIDLFVDTRQFKLDLNAIYPHLGVLPPSIGYPSAPGSLDYLTQALPRADPGQPVFIDVARSVVGGEQIVGRIAGLQDPAYNLPGALAGTLVETTEDRQFPNGPYVTFVGELQE